MAEAPYQRSRAALRREYGSRAIDARSRQSPLDTTPSGKLARFREMGISEKKVSELYNQEFSKQFERSNTLTPPPQIRTRIGIQNPIAPVPVQNGVQTLFGPDSIPYKPIGLLPETAPAESFAPFTPSAPLTSFALPKPTVLSNGSKWNRPAFG